MITHGGILTAYCKAKEAILKSLHTMWFHIYDILEKTKLWRQSEGQWLPVVREEKGDEYFLLREQLSLLFFMSLSELNYRQSGGGSDVSFNHTGFTSK